MTNIWGRREYWDRMVPIICLFVYHSYKQQCRTGILRSMCRWSTCLYIIATNNTVGQVASNREVLTVCLFVYPYYKQQCRTGSL
jgi:hypothetical protein